MSAAGSYYFVIVSHRDTPLYELHFTSSKAGVQPATSHIGPTSFSVFNTDPQGRTTVGYGPKTSKHVQQMVAHASLDAIEDAQWSVPYMCLKGVDRFREWNISAWVSPGGIKLILLHEGKADDSIRLFLHDSWEAYTKLLLNPFYEVGGQLRSSAFDNRVRLSARKYL